MADKICPFCGGKMILFFPNIPIFTGWYCVNNDYVLPATEGEIVAELERRNDLFDGLGDFTPPDTPPLPHSPHKD